MNEDGHLGCKVLSIRRIVTLLIKEAPANSVPAAAVRQGERVLFYIIWRKGFVGYLIS